MGHDRIHPARPTRDPPIALIGIAGDRTVSLAFVAALEDERLAVVAASPWNTTARAASSRSLMTSARGCAWPMTTLATVAWRLSHDRKGNLTVFTRPDGSVRRYRYGDTRHPHTGSGILKREYDPNGYVARANDETTVPVPVT